MHPRGAVWVPTHHCLLPGAWYISCGKRKLKRTTTWILMHILAITHLALYIARLSVHIRRYVATITLANGAARYVGEQTTGSWTLESRPCYINSQEGFRTEHISELNIRVI